MNKHQPVYLRRELAESAINLASPSILKMLTQFGERSFVHVVILDATGEQFNY